jgi:hypothetical protein
MGAYSFFGKIFLVLSLLAWTNEILLVLFIESDKKEKSPKEGDNKGIFGKIFLVLSLLAWTNEMVIIAPHLPYSTNKCKTYSIAE